MGTSKKTEKAAAAATEAAKTSESAASTDTTTATPTAKKIMVKRKELPSIGHMLIHGAPESQGREKTWAEIVAFPLVLLVLFVISFYIFLNSPPSKYPPGRYRLPQSQMPASMIKEALSQQQQATSQATPKTEVQEEF
jgi:hypothetical protein